MCGGEIPQEDRRFVSLFPQLDASLLSYDVLDTIRRRAREDNSGEEEEEEEEEENQPAVLPKLTCRHCGKTFSRKSTLEQHMVTHSTSEDNETWEEVQDAAIDDLEQAIVYE